MPEINRFFGIIIRMFAEHAIHRIESFEIVAPYILCIRFEDGTQQTINFEPLLAGELYGPLRDLQLFNQARIDSDAHTLVWPNGADFDVIGHIRMGDQ